VRVTQQFMKFIYAARMLHNYIVFMLKISLYSTVTSELLTYKEK